MFALRAATGNDRDSVFVRIQRVNFEKRDADIGGRRNAADVFFKAVTLVNSAFCERDGKRLKCID